MKILVIGNGFIASSIIQRLEFEGHELLVFSRTASEIIHSKQIVGDIFDFDEFFKVLSWKPQIVIHTAWITTPGLYRNDDSNFKYAQFTTRLAESTIHSDVEHLLVLGTCAEYGHQIGPSIAGITTLGPSTLYSKQKVTAFNSVNQLLQDVEMRFTWARIFYPYGPGQDRKRLIPHLIHSLKNGSPIVLDDISSIHDWISIRDISSAISWVIKSEVPSEVDIGTSIGFTNLELLANLEDLLLDKSQLYPHSAHNFGNNDVFVAGEESPLFKSGWFPKDSLRSGLEWVLDS